MARIVVPEGRAVPHEWFHAYRPDPCPRCGAEMWLEAGTNEDAVAERCECGWLQVVLRPGGGVPVEKRRGEVVSLGSFRGMATVGSSLFPSSD